MKKIRQRLTYANVMSSLAVFLVLGGATAIAASKIGSNQLKANSVLTGKIKKEAVTASKIKNSAVVTSKLANDAVTSGKIDNNAVTGAQIADNAISTNKIANDAVTGAKVNEATLVGVVQNVTFVSAASAADSEDEKVVTVDCGVGKKVLGGFYKAFDFGPDVKVTVHIMRRITISGEAGRGLQVFAEEDPASANIWQLTATATCATI